MSLLDAFLRDSWQNTVVRSEVFFAIRTDGAAGAGTSEDPYNGNGYLNNNPANATRFDSIMNDTVKVPEGTTVRLGPSRTGATDTPYLTRGYIVSTGSVSGWKARSGLRLLGAGMNATTLQVVAAAQPYFNVAIGNNEQASADFLNGFEASDFTVDCNLTSQATNTAVGATALSGKHVYLSRLRVINFGGKGSSAPRCLVLSNGRAHYSNGNTPFDCVIDGCIVEQPYIDAAVVQPIICLHLGAVPHPTVWSSNIWNQACVIRNCYVDCGSANLARDLRGIAAYGGIGTIVECNRIINCRRGGPYKNSADTTDELPVKDLVARENYFYNVVIAIQQSMPGAGSDTSNVVGRLFAHDNVIELALSGVVGDYTPTGIVMTGASSTGPRRFTNIILSGNAIRPKDNDTLSPATRYGITFDSCTEALVEDNIINLGLQSTGVDNPPNNAVRHDNSCSKVTVFNNQKASGEFLPVYNSQSGLHDWELTNDAENALLAL